MVMSSNLYFKKKENYATTLYTLQTETTINTILSVLLQSL